MTELAPLTEVTRARLWRRRRRRLGRVLLLLGVALGILLLVHPYLAGWIAARELAKEFGRPGSLMSVRRAWVTAAISLENVCLADARPGAGDLLTIAAVETDATLAEIIDQRWNDRQVTLRRPCLNLVGEGSGRWNLARLMNLDALDGGGRPPDPERRPPTVLVRDGEVTIRPRAEATGAQVVRLTGVDVDLRPSLTPSHRYVITRGRMHEQTGGRLSVRGNLGGEEEQLVVEGRRFNVTPEMLELLVPKERDKLWRWLRLSGAADVRCEMSFPRGQLDFSAAINALDVQVGTPAVAIPIVGLKGDINLDPEGMTITGIHGMWCGGEVLEGDMHVAFIRPDRDCSWDLNLRFDGLLLSQLANAVNAPQLASGAYANAWLRIGCDGPGLENLVGSGSARVRHTNLADVWLVSDVLSLMGMPRDNGTLTIDFRVAGEKVLLDRILLEGPLWQVTGRGEVGFDGELDLTFQPGLRSVGIPILGPVVDVFKQVAGFFTGPLTVVRVSGPASDPSVRLQTLSL